MELSLKRVLWLPAVLVSILTESTPAEIKYLSRGRSLFDELFGLYMPLEESVHES